MHTDAQEIMAASSSPRETRPRLGFLRRLNPFRPLVVLLVFTCCLGASVDLGPWLDGNPIDAALDNAARHARASAELDAGLGEVGTITAGDYPHSATPAKTVTITAGTGDAVDALLTAAYRLLTFSTLDPIRSSVTACQDEVLAWPVHCNVVLRIPAIATIAESFRDRHALAFALRHELGHVIFWDHDGWLAYQLQEAVPGWGELLHSVLIESEADVYAVLKTAQRDGGAASQEMLDGLLAFRRIRPLDSQGAPIGTHDTTDSLAELDARRPWLGDAAAQPDAAIVRQAEMIAIDGFRAYAVRNGIALTDRLVRILSARQAAFDSTALDSTLGTLSIGVERAPSYAAVFAGDGEELPFTARHPLLNLLFWCVLWTLFLRAGWRAVDFMLREIEPGGRTRPSDPSRLAFPTRRLVFGE